MTADQTPRPPVPWRVKLKTRQGTWYSIGLTEAEAVVLTGRIGGRLIEVRDGTGLVDFPTRYGVTAFIRARDVHAVEPVGPRWDGVEDFARPADVPADPEPAPAAPEDPPALTGVQLHVDSEPVSDAQAWLQRRVQQQASRVRGHR